MEHDESGAVQLVPRAGDENIVRKEKVSAVGPKIDTERTAEFDLSQNAVADMSDQYTMEDGGAARGDKYSESEVFTLTLPEGPEEGDLLHLTTHLGMMVLPIPTGAFAGCRLQAQGAIEFMIPEGKFPGDLVTLQTPEGVAMPIEIPENTTPGSFLQVAYPVVVLPPNDDEAVDHEGECGVLTRKVRTHKVAFRRPRACSRQSPSQPPSVPLFPFPLASRSFGGVASPIPF